MTSAFLIVLLSQAEPAPAAAAAVDGGSPAAAPSAPRNRSADDAVAMAKKLFALPDDERPQAVADLRRKFGDMPGVLPPTEVDLGRYLALAPQDQARICARYFFNALLASGANELATQAGYPFQLEDRRIERADELRSEWAKKLRSKRADLLTLYDIEVLAPADMEKKYGKPPSRLGNWNWRAPNSYLAVANLSGHAAVVLLRPSGLTWQVVGYHD